MTELRLREIALLFVNKGYADHGVLRDSDGLYSATEEDRDLCCDFLDEILQFGAKNQQDLIDNLKASQGDNITVQD